MAKVELCPAELLPKCHQYPYTGQLMVEFPDVCHCPVNGGPDFKVHLALATCIQGIEHLESQVEVTVEGVLEPPLTWGCTCPPGDDGQPPVARWLAQGHVEGLTHLPNCPFDNCPVGTCHPMCKQVTGIESDLYCHCPCHG